MANTSFLNTNKIEAGKYSVWVVVPKGDTRLAPPSAENCTVDASPRSVQNPSIITNYITTKYNLIPNDR